MVITVVLDRNNRIRHALHLLVLNQNKQIIQGDGVVGEQPIIEPKQKYSYNSFCPLKTQFGTMKGYYIFRENLSGDECKVKIPEFVLTVPNSIN